MYTICMNIVTSDGATKKNPAQIRRDGKKTKKIPYIVPSKPKRLPQKRG